ncbi:MAG: ribosome biogenesis GTP-binding protein YihA/YsxC [Bacillota bacterium]|jgi:GTP-binding protein
MKIKKAELVVSAVKKSQYPPQNRPEIVFLGRSNVGKSSLINTLVNRRNLARTSGQPGKTRLLNFYHIEAETSSGQHDWYLVDLPGYGYAKVAKSQREKWLTMIEEFLLSRMGEKYCWQIVDIRHKPSEQDKIMYNVLKNAGYRLLLIASKADKISRGQREKHLREIVTELGATRDDIIAFSAVTREGKEELLALAESFVNSQNAIGPY